jgi:hypothetical protein
VTLNDEERENTREALRMDGWYALVRTPRGLKRASVAMDEEWKDDGPDSGTIEIRAHLRLRADQALGERFPVVLGVFHPLLLPDALDRAEPRAD